MNLQDDCKTKILFYTLGALKTATSVLVSKFSNGTAGVAVFVRFYDFNYDGMFLRVAINFIDQGMNQRYE